MILVVRYIELIVLYFAFFCFTSQNCSGKGNPKDFKADVSIMDQRKDSAVKQNMKFEINKDKNTLSNIRYSQRKQVPVLCYHRIVRELGKYNLYTVSKVEFQSQLKMLYDSGYQTILPDQLYQYLDNGKPLPFKPIMLSFDDTREEHYTIAAPEMKKFGFKGVFFIMNISIGKLGYMNNIQIQALSDSGHVIGCHTWDHHNVNELHGSDWQIQIDQPKARLEHIINKSIDYFSYPFGVWNDSAVHYLQVKRFKAAFQLSGKQSSRYPLFTIRRIIVPYGWSAYKLNKHIKLDFK